MNQTSPVGQANWRVAELETVRPLDAFYLTGIGLLIGLITGAVIAFFRFAKDGAYAYALHWTAIHKASTLYLVLWFMLALAAALLVGYLIRNPAIRAGGADWIGDAIERGQSRPWLKILFPKFLGSWLVLAFGISVGSEGPCIQMGAATADGLRKFDSRQAIERKYFILAGCAAGLAGAFSAPFAGICYVYEIMNIKFTRPLFVFLLAAGIGVYLAYTQLFGLGVMLPLDNTSLPGLIHFWALVPLAVFASIIGIAYNYFLRWSSAIYDRQKLIPQFWRPMLPFLVAAILVLVFPPITGEGMGFFPTVLHDNPLPGYLCLFIVTKLIFTAFCYGSGIPAGVMVPVLVLGGVTGALYSDIAIQLGVMSGDCAGSCIAMGMAAAFAAAERAPVTGIVLVMEVTGAYAIAPAMLLVAAISTVCARFAKVQTI